MTSVWRDPAEESELLVRLALRVTLDLQDQAEVMVSRGPWVTEAKMVLKDQTDRRVRLELLGFPVTSAREATPVILDSWEASDRVDQRVIMVKTACQAVTVTLEKMVL